MPEFWVLLHLWHWETMVRKALFLGTTWKQKYKDKNTLVNLRTMILLFFNICMHLLQQSAKERCSWRQFLLKHLTVMRAFRPPKAEVQSDTSWCILLRTVTPSCCYGALSLSERSKSPFSVTSVSSGLSSVASSK